MKTQVPLESHRQLNHYMYHRMIQHGVVIELTHM